MSQIRSVKYPKQTKCPNCDHSFTYEPAHGSLTMYTSRKCRCELCRAAMASYVAARRERKKALNAGTGGH